VVSRTELTQSFGTRGNWSLVITQEPPEPVASGNLHFCFVHDGRPECPSAVIPPCERIDGKLGCPPPESGGFVAAYNTFETISIFQPPDSDMTPLLVVRAGGIWGGPGSNFGPIVYRYRVETDRFEELFADTRKSNTNGEIRLVTTGPLAGDISADNAGGRRHASAYELIVYGLQRPEHYVRILDYFGRTTYADGNRLSVIDGEMPEIQRRLGVWKPGDALPVPMELPPACRIELRNGVEWCAKASP
jgi:hypothetical protein